MASEKICLWPLPSLWPYLYLDTKSGGDEGEDEQLGKEKEVALGT